MFWDITHWSSECLRIKVTKCRWLQYSTTDSDTNPTVTSTNTPGTESGNTDTVASESESIMTEATIPDVTSPHSSDNEPTKIQSH